MCNDNLVLEKLDRVEKILSKKPSRFELSIQLIEKIALPLLIGCLTYVVGISANKISQSQQNLSERQYETQLHTKYIELFYNDITSNDSNRKFKALSLINQINPELLLPFVDFPEVFQENSIKDPLRSTLTLSEDYFDADMWNSLLPFYFHLQYTTNSLITYCTDLLQFANPKSNTPIDTSILAEAINKFFDSLSTPKMPAEYSATVQSMSETTSNIRAASSISKAIEKASPAVRSIIELLRQDIGHFDRILIATSKFVTHRIIMQNNDFLSYRRSLEKRKIALRNEFSVAHNHSDNESIEAELQQITKMLEDTNLEYTNISAKEISAHAMLDSIREVLPKASSILYQLAESHERLPQVMQQRGVNSLIEINRVYIQIRMLSSILSNRIGIIIENSNKPINKSTEEAQ